MSQAIVIGAGIVGTSAALELARRGWKVRVFDPLGGAGRGSTSKSSTVIRCHYTLPEGIELAAEGRALWKEWPEYTGLSRPRASYQEVGVIFLLHKQKKKSSGPLALGVKAEVSGEDIEERVSMMNRLGVRAELLGARDLQKRFPHLRVEKGEPVVGIYEPESGYVAYARGSVEDLHEAAKREGVQFHFGERVRKIDTAWNGSVREVTGVSSARRYRADVVLNCAGPDSARVNLLAQCPLPLMTAPLRQYVVEGVWKNPPSSPIPAMADLGFGFYIRPDQKEFKVGAVLPRHHVDFETGKDPKRERQFREELLRGFRRRLPGVTLQKVQVKQSYYDWTVSDSYPIIDATDVNGFYVAIGTSGAWFKSGPVIGQLAAELASGEGKRGSHLLPRTGRHVQISAFGRNR
ncbi:MAG: FAD-dependent oxidoreductase [Planctomycetota bacterium]|nr:FAD-dependent oxidoreductase [Planctomycetota bacterium]